MRRTRTITKALTITLAVLVLVTTTRADSYSTFTTTKYYSADRRFYVEVTPKRLATLYRVDSRRPRRQWSRVLPALPDRLLVSNDGTRVAIVDRYYGNGGNPEMPAVVLLNETGSEIASHKLAEVANLSKVITSTSAAHWYSKVAFSSDESDLLIDTIVAKREPALCTRINSSEESDDCSRSIPYEQLRFRIANGELISRTNIAVAGER